MAKFGPVETQLKSGEILLIREATGDDASDLLSYVEAISGESDNLTFGPGEFDITLEQEAQFLAGLQKQDNSIYLVALLDGTIVGSISFMGGRRARTAHTGEFGVSVLKAHWGKGIGTALMEALLKWCRGTGTIRKVNLRVRPDNTGAIQIYRKLGFKEEGRITRDLYINGVFIDSTIMGYEID
jgi:RimJ/RimL family protein N-acetyltransferase